MNKADPIIEQDVTIGLYTLGLLTAQDNARIQALLSANATAARSALHWEETFLTLVDALPSAHPPQALLNNILTALDLPLPANDSASPVAPPPRPTSPVMASVPEPAADTRPADLAESPRNDPALHTVSARNHNRDGTHNRDDTLTQEPEFTHQESSTRSSSVEPTHTAPPARPPTPSQTIAKKSPKSLWLGGAAVVVALAALLTMVFIPSTPAEPPVVVVEIAPSKGAILQAPGQTSTPGWVVTIDPENNVTLTPQVHTEAPADASVQLWTYSKALPQPRSLGLIDPNQPVAVPADIMGEIRDDQFFEMTLEPEGGSPTSEPTGHILFIGRVVTFSQ